jgi:hypothetical protein
VRSDAVAGVGGDVVELEPQLIVEGFVFKQYVMVFRCTRSVPVFVEVCVGIAQVASLIAVLVHHGEAAEVAGGVDDGVAFPNVVLQVGGGGAVLTP